VNKCEESPITLIKLEVVISLVVKSQHFIAFVGTVGETVYSLFN
jgi:hypothetical protein